MFQPARYITSNFSVFFQHQPEIRKKVYRFEEQLEGHYGPAEVVPIPDYFDPETPRMIFGSKKGHSTIVVSQIGIVLNVTYSPDWQTDISKGRDYLLERIPLLFRLLAGKPRIRPLFCGFSTSARLPSTKKDSEIVQFVTDRFLSDAAKNKKYDIALRFTTLRESRYFSNAVIQNYRLWNAADVPQGMIRMSAKSAIERGVECSIDFNDRYRYNESEQYRTKLESATKILDDGIADLQRLVSMFLQE